MKNYQAKNHSVNIQISKQKRLRRLYLHHFMKTLILLALACSIFACTKTSEPPVESKPIDRVTGIYSGKKLEIQQVYGDTSTILRPEVWEDYSFSIQAEVVNHNKIRVSFNTGEPIKNKVIELPLTEEVEITGGIRYNFSADIRKPDHFLSTLIRIDKFTDSSKPSVLFINFTNATIENKIMDQETILATAEK